MPLPVALERGYHRVADFIAARWPQPVPSPDQARQCKIIAHRGVFDNLRIMENTLAAFELARKTGVWGIEFDVRWTSDQAPVVIHDADLRRLFGVGAAVDRIPYDVLKAKAPAVPALSDVVMHFGGGMHLMIEVKVPLGSHPSLRYDRLREVLGCLEPVQDYHLMSMQPEHLAAITDLPSEALVAIAYARPDRLSRWVIRHHWGGLCAHYALMRRSLVALHKAHRQKVGTGFASSRNSLFREIKRGIDWIFSDQAATMQATLKQEHT